jgi:two-component system nitrogen regulation response regulator GlnG
MHPKDLYYRLRGVVIAVPPLRERTEDLAELARHFLFRFNRELARDLRGFDPETLAIFQQYSWPGNVRELQGVIKEAILRATGNWLLPEFLSSVLSTAPPLKETAPLGDSADLRAYLEELLQRGEKSLHARIVQRVERILFARVLQHTHGHQAHAAELLGIDRSTLRTKLRELGMSVEKLPVQESPDSPK